VIPHYDIEKRRNATMRKLIVATAITVVLAGSASAADVRFNDRGSRERENPIVRIFKLIKRTFTPATNNWPTVPIP
jgi:hypothetical protein